MDIGSLLLMLGLAYGLGVLWYDLLPGQLSDRVGVWPPIRLLASGWPRRCSPRILRMIPRSEAFISSQRSLARSSR